jgi:hypothetical protein
MTHTRRRFLRSVPTLGAFSIVAQPFGPVNLAAQAFRPADLPAQPDWPARPAPGSPADDFFPSLHPSLVKDVVGLSHSNLARVTELVQQHPALAKASWDWGYGDAETALGAASHVGQRAIAELLLENGAPPTLFSATMLGQLDVVKAFLAATPGLQRIRGPHSLSLMVHARAGGPPAAAVVSYLESIGDAALPLTDEPLSTEERATLDGRYVFGDRARDTFTVTTTPTQVSLARAGATARFIRHLGRLEFVPPGAPAVRIRFERDGARVAALAICDPDVVVRARKV